jgi:hypothetical protein
MDWDQPENPRKELALEIAREGVETLVEPFKPSIVRRIVGAATPRSMTAEYYAWRDPARIVRYYSGRDLMRIHFAGRPHVIPSVAVGHGWRETDPSSIAFVIEDRAFELDAETRARTDRVFKQYRRFLWWKRRHWHNGRLLRLSSVDSSLAGLALRVCATYYEDVSRTHLCLDARVKTGERTLREVLHPDGALCRLDESRFANALGVNFLIFTADDKLVISRRSKRVVVAPEMLGPAVAGDFDAIDPTVEGRLETSRLLREPFEEISLTEGDLVDGSLRFLGLGRDLGRGGKPESFFVAHTRLSEAALHQKHAVASHGWEHDKNWVFWPFEGAGAERTPPVCHRLRTALDRLLEKHRHRMTTPLLAALAFWSAPLYA